MPNRRHQHSPSRALEPLAKLNRRIRIALFCEHAVRAALVLAMVAATVVLAARVAFGVHLPPQWSWLYLGLTLSIVWGIVSARQNGLSPTGLATFLDRRHQLGGLLVTSLEKPTEQWDPLLKARIDQSAAAVLPSLKPSRWLVRIAGVALFFWALTLLPAPQVTVRQNSLIAQQIERIAEDVELALEAGAISEDEAQELRDRAEEMEQRLEEGLDVAWSDADGLQERLEHDESVRLDRLASMRAELGEFQAAADKAGMSAQQDLAAALDHAQALGLAPDLDADLAELAQKIAEAQEAAESSAGEAGESGEGPDGAPGADTGMAGGLDLSHLNLDAEQLAKLAEALEGASEQRLADLEDAGQLDPSQLEDLSKILSEAREGC